MKVMPMGDYYVWFCDWCDSRNHTLWTRVATKGAVCSACHRSGRSDSDVRGGERYPVPLHHGRLSP